MRNVMMTILAIALAVVILGCSQPSDTGSQTSTDIGQEVQQDNDRAVHSTATPSTDKVEVADTGTKLDPAVEAQMIPDEAWACVMGGKVHYAAMQKGDGTCPVCKMKLIQHAAHSDQ